MQSKKSAGHNHQKSSIGRFGILINAISTKKSIKVMLPH
jgi:hypothetical protein